MSPVPDHLFQPVVLQFPPPRCTPDLALRYLGTGGHRTKAWAQIEEAAAMVQEEWGDCLSQRACLGVAAARKCSPRLVQLAGQHQVKCSSRFFEGATHAALAVVTLGPRVEQAQELLFKKGAFLEAFVLEALAVASLEQGFLQVREALKELVGPHGMHIGYALSPGCQALSLQAQKALFKLVQPGLIGVSLLESLMMTPIKTTSSIIPLGQKLRTTGGNGKACEVCGARAKCKYRQMST